MRSRSRAGLCFCPVLLPGSLACGSAPLRFSLEAGQQQFLNHQYASDASSMAESSCHTGFAGVPHLAHSLCDWLSKVGMMFSESIVHITPDQESR